MDRKQFLQNLQYPGERKSLILSILLVLFLTLVASYISFRVVLTALVLGFLWIRIRQGQLLGNSILVTSASFSSVHDIFKKACDILQEDMPRVHIDQDPYLNAYALGFSTPFSIVINSATLKALNEQELAFIAGHELAHIKFRHTTWLSIISPFGQQRMGLHYLFTIWQRKAEYTCDRAGLLVCGDINSAISSLLKISSGQESLDQINVSEFLQQLKSADNMSRIGELLGSHPYISNRVAQLLKFADSPHYQALCNTAPVNGTTNMLISAEPILETAETITPPLIEEVTYNENDEPRHEQKGKDLPLLDQEDEDQPFRPDPLNEVTIQDKNQPSPAKTRGSPLKRILKPAVGLAVFTLVCVLIVRSFADKAALTRLYETAEFDSLVTYIIENRNKESSLRKVEYAISLVVKAEDARPRDKLIDATLEHDLSSQLLDKILDSLNTYGHAIGDLRKTTDLYIQYFSMQDKFLPFFAAFDPPEIEAVFMSTIADAYKRNGVETAISVADALARLQYVPDPKMQGIRGALKNIEEGAEKLAAATERTQKAELVLQDKQGLLVTDILELSFYVIHQHEANLYEIAVGEWGGYYVGYVPASKHSLLKTTSKSYSSKGWATLSVMRLPDTPITLTEEAGGFVQDWATYMEADAKTIEKIANNKAELNQAQSELKERKEEEATQKSYFKETENALYDTCYPKKQPSRSELLRNAIGGPFDDNFYNITEKIPDESINSWDILDTCTKSVNALLQWLDEDFKPILEAPHVTYMNGEPGSIIIGSTGRTIPSGRVFIEGLASVYEGTIVYDLLDSEGNVICTSHTTTRGDLGYSPEGPLGWWGYFVLDLPDSGYDSVFIYWESPADGEGIADSVTINVAT